MKCLLCETEMAADSERCHVCDWTYHLEEEDLSMEGAKPACISCLEPFLINDHYCRKCGEVVGRYTAYLPFINILFELNFMHKIWKSAWGKGECSVWKRIFFIAFCCLLCPIFTLCIFIELFKKFFSKNES